MCIISSFFRLVIAGSFLDLCLLFSNLRLIFCTVVVLSPFSYLFPHMQNACTDKCNEAIANAFKDFWLKEQVTSTEDNKIGVAICFSYLR